MACTVEILLSNYYRWDDRSKTFVTEKFKSILPDSKAQCCPITSQKIPTEAMNLGTTLKIYHFQICHELDMIFWLKIKIGFLPPSFYLLIIFSTITIWY